MIEKSSNPPPPVHVAHPCSNLSSVMLKVDGTVMKLLRAGSWSVSGTVNTRTNASSKKTHLPAKKSDKK